jgi:16S rRNA (adenine1518-N6/adenine1519-N6)-dimethyltransferase
MKLLQDNLPLKSITVMVQKEVAQRLTAIPGDKEAGAITYSINYFTNATTVLDVPRNCFIPSPDVDSAVIKLELLNKPRVEVLNENHFFEIIKAAFSQKRKTLINGLVNNKIISSKEEAENLLISIGLDPKIRGEKLTLEEFAKLSNSIKKGKSL